MSHSQQQPAARRPFARRVVLFVSLAVLTGVVTVAAIGPTLAGAGWHGHHARHWGQVSSVEDAQRRGRQLGAWVAGEVDAAPVQAAAIEEILAELGSALYPLREAHRKQHLRLVTELSRPTVDAQALQALRQDTLALTERLSGEVVKAVLALSDVLEPQQRQHLAALVADFGHRRRH